MTTSNGLPRTNKMRGYIDRLERRRVFLIARMAAYEKEHGVYAAIIDRSFERQEIAALEWAIPVLETEWDNAARLHRMHHVNVDPANVS